jgi:para-nitrobenzyl esterase
MRVTFCGGQAGAFACLTLASPRSLTVAALFVALTTIAIAQTPPKRPAKSLAGTSWRLVHFVGPDGHTLSPVDRAKYTVAFSKDGTVNVRIDCNRGRGTWKSPGPNQLQFGPLALTRAMCPPGPLNDRLVKDWPMVRLYTIRDRHLFISLMGDTGVYEFEPLAQ